MRAWWVLGWAVVLAGVGWAQEEVELPPRTYAGQVMGGDGAPLAGVEVVIVVDEPFTDEREDSVTFERLTTDAEGRFAYLTQASPYLVKGAMAWTEEGLGIAGWYSLEDDWGMFDPAPEPKLATVRIQPWIAASGLVTDATGQPLVGVAVELMAVNTAVHVAMMAAHGMEVDDDLDLEALLAHGAYEPLRWPPD